MKRSQSCVKQQRSEDYTLTRSHLESTHDTQSTAIALNESYFKQIEPKAFQNFTQLKTVQITNGNLSELRKDIFSKSNHEQDFASIETIDLSHNRISRLDANPFLYVRNLHELSLSANWIEHLHRNVFSHLRQLRHVNLSQNSLKRVDRELFRGLSRLESIDLSRNQLRCVEPGTFCDLPALAVLSLARNRVCSVEADAFANLPALRRLDLSHNRVEYVCAELLAATGSRHSHVELDLSHNRIKPEERRLVERAFQALHSPEWSVNLEQNRSSEAFALPYVTKLNVTLAAAAVLLGGGALVAAVAFFYRKFFGVELNDRLIWIIRPTNFRPD